MSFCGRGEGGKGGGGSCFRGSLFSYFLTMDGLLFILRIRFHYTPVSPYPMATLFLWFVACVIFINYLTGGGFFFSFFLNY